MDEDGNVKPHVHQAHDAREGMVRKSLLARHSTFNGVHTKILFVVDQIYYPPPPDPKADPLASAITFTDPRQPQLALAEADTSKMTEKQTAGNRRKTEMI